MEYIKQNLTHAASSSPCKMKLLLSYVIEEEAQKHCYLFLVSERKNECSGAGSGDGATTKLDSVNVIVYFTSFLNYFF